MKYLITRSCGHQETVYIYGRSQDISRSLLLEKEKLCKACWQSQQEEMEKDIGLPELEGSPEQVKWAKRIRWDYIEEAENHLRPLGVRLQDLLGDENPEGDALRIKKLFLVTSAAWWIKNRYNDLRLMAILADL